MKKILLVGLLLVFGLVIPASAFIGFQPVYTPPKPPTMFAQLSDSNIQTCPNGSIANVTFSNNDAIHGIVHSTVQDTQEIIIQRGGIYHFIAVPQIGKIGQTTGEHNFWVTLNGVPVENTNVKATIQPLDQANKKVSQILSWVATLQPNDVVVFQQLCNSDNIIMRFTNSTENEPASPSIILTILKP